MGQTVIKRTWPRRAVSYPDLRDFRAEVVGVGLQCRVEEEMADEGRSEKDVFMNDFCYERPEATSAVSSRPTDKTAQAMVGLFGRVAWWCGVRSAAYPLLAAEDPRATEGANGSWDEAVRRPFPCQTFFNSSSVPSRSSSQGLRTTWDRGRRTSPSPRLRHGITETWLSHADRRCGAVIATQLPRPPFDGTDGTVFARQQLSFSTTLLSFLPRFTSAPAASRLYSLHKRRISSP